MKLTHKERRLMRRVKARSIVHESLLHRGFSYTEAEIFIKLLSAPAAKEKSHKPFARVIVDLYV